MSADLWAVPASFPPLTPGTVQVWRVSLDADSGEDADTGEAAFAILSPDERTRAERFRRPQDVRRFAQSRCALRRILGQTLRRNPAGLRFDYGPQGKPALAADTTVAFNVSHSADIGLIALRGGGEIGVDIEEVRAGFHGDAIAERFFCAAELDWLRSLPTERRQDGFFRLWTRKEAFLKARGEGLWRELDHYDVTQSPPIRVADAAAEAGWSLHDLDAGAGYRAALAMQGSVTGIVTWQWKP